MSVSYREARTDGELLACAGVRWAVFVLEQRVAPVLEIDARDFDPATRHILAEDGRGRPVGACRILPGGPGRAHLGRVAVARGLRGRGIGAGLVRFAHALLAERARREGRPIEVRLEAQVQARGFYAGLGYRVLPGPEFLDAGIRHVAMSRRVGAGDAG